MTSDQLSHTKNLGFKRSVVYIFVSIYPPEFESWGPSLVSPPKAPLPTPVSLSLSFTPFLPLPPYPTRMHAHSPPICLQSLWIQAPNSL